MDPKRNRQLNVLAIVSGFVFETLAIIGLGFVAGYYLDQWLNTDIVFTAVLMILASLYAVYHLIRVVNKTSDDNESK